ncbi:DNA topoisomerase II [Acinetobacter phage Acj9]|uniref:DNA topoisomerase (ATP-hydrolyzing) n=1 Tax=Acinetobacter phage Acj9 TaxID=760939 RepID=E5EQ32_9CAUD|nr:DNA topoisomerase II [Acinetobacter phage Acj9]ADG60148.1 gp52 topoisomerase II medium subunit [Acinetobacter phage Acj9]
MQLTDRELTQIINNEAKIYAMYTVENRAIPNLIDGLKPVQRFMLYRAIQLAKGKSDKFHKLASVAGGVADAGYHHGENSAQEAGALMANTWNNNFPFLDGQGNFGSRLVQQAAASRYIFCRVSENFNKVYKDTEIAPEHEDLEHLPPRFYLPIIPTVLLNGVRGIATGYSTSILPHDFESIVRCTEQALNGETVSMPTVAFPQFRGEVYCTEPNKYELHGTYNFTSKTQMYISEIPYQFDRAKYVEKVLDPLEDAGLITYDDDCSKEGFGFKIKFRKDYKLPTDVTELDEKIKRDFKLVERVSQNIVVIDENGKLHDRFENSAQLVEHFVKVRLSFVEKRIGFMIEKSKHAFELAYAKALFIREVTNEKIQVKGKKRSELKEELAQLPALAGFEDQLLAMNIFHMTEDEMANLLKKAKEAKEQMDYWKSTDALTEYKNDIKELKSIL